MSQIKVTWPPSGSPIIGGDNSREEKDGDSIIHHLAHIFSLRTG